MGRFYKIKLIDEMNLETGYGPPDMPEAAATDS
jgi:hypothetical protein